MGTQTQVDSENKAAYEVVYDGEKKIVVRILIPQKRTRVKPALSQIEGHKPYLQFGHFTKDGLINCFFYPKEAEPSSFVGKWVRARIKIVRKTLPDGRSFLQLNLFETYR